MFNLFDILQAQGGGVQSLGQQFGLSPDQSRRAMEALLPALTLGLQRNAASDPAAFGRLFGLVAPGARPAPQQPDMLLGQLFGSPALSQAVLQQAAAASGIGQQALRQMLPIMAGMVVAGLVHAMLNQPPPAPAREPQPPSPFSAADFWNDWMNTFLSAASAGSGPGSQPAARTDRRAGEPLRGLEQPVEAPRRSPFEPAVPKPSDAGTSDTKASDTSSREAGDVPLEVFQQMFQAGVQVQEQNVRAMQDIFDSFWREPSAAAGTDVAGARAPEPAEAESGTAEDGSRKPRTTQSKPGKAG